MEYREQTPPTWLPLLQQLPILLEVTHWQLLRKWSLSEVWRITTRSGKTWIAKWARGSQSIELDIYLHILRPMQIATPSPHSFARTENGHFFILEDLGLETIEQQPQETYFVEAAKALVRLRTSAARSLSTNLHNIPQRFVISPQKYLNDVAFLLDHPQLTAADKGVLARLSPWLSTQLTSLYTQIPLTLNHNDYNPKNLVINGDTIVPVDWSNASISPHLGDLYCLIREAEQSSVSASLLISAFQAETRLQREEASRENISLEGQIALGGICWLLTGIRWVLTEGMYAVPSSLQWLPDMLQDLEPCITLYEKAN